MMQFPRYTTVLITPAVRKAVFAAWDDTCAYCRVRPAEHCDHIFPKARGGQDALENYAAACATCNLMKTDMILGEGILHIVQAHAATKAPAIRARLARQSKPAADPAPLLEQLAEVRLEWDLLARSLRDPSEHDVISLKATIAADIEATFAGATITAIKKEIASVRARTKRKQRSRAQAPLREELAQLRHQNGRDLDEARAEVEEEYGASGREEIARAIARQRRRNKPRKPDRVEMPIPPKVRRILLRILPEVPDDEDGKAFSISRAAHPEVHDWFFHHQGIYFDAGWHRMEGSSRILYCSGATPDLVTLWYRRAGLYFLAIAEELDTEQITFPSHHDFWVLPDRSDCRAEGFASQLA